MVKDKSSIFSNIRQNLRKHMKNRGLTIKDLEQLSGVSEPTIKRIRTQQLSPNTGIDVLNKLAVALDVTIMDLIGHDQNDSTGEEKYDKEKFFVYRFKSSVFEFPENSKALFKKRVEGDALTKYFFDREYDFYKLISAKEFEVIATNKNDELCSLKYEDIIAVISKKYYGDADHEQG